MCIIIFSMCSVLWGRERERANAVHSETELLRDERISARPLLCHSLGGMFECVIRVSWVRQTRLQEHTLRHAHTVVPSLTEKSLTLCYFACARIACVYSLWALWFPPTHQKKPVHRLTTVGVSVPHSELVSYPVSAPAMHRLLLEECHTDYVLTDHFNKNTCLVMQLCQQISL